MRSGLAPPLDAGMLRGVLVPRLELVNPYVGKGRLLETGVLVESVLRKNPT